MKVVVILDVSGSVSPAQREVFLETVAQLATQLNLSLKVVEADNQVRRTYEYSEKSPVSTVSGGETAFSPALSYVSRLARTEDIGLVLYLTDGLTTENEIIPCSLPVFWIYPAGYSRCSASFGNHLWLN